MLSKDFFVKNATEKVRQLIRHSLKPYPEQCVFQDNLQIKADWDLYKRQLIDDLTAHI